MSDNKIVVVLKLFQLDDKMVYFLRKHEVNRFSCMRKQEGSEFLWNKAFTKYLENKFVYVPCQRFFSAFLQIRLVPPWSNSIPNLGTIQKYSFRCVCFWCVGVSEVCAVAVSLVCLYSPCMSAPSGRPLWVDPCGGTSAPSGPHHDLDISSPPVQELLEHINISARHALDEARDFSEIYVSTAQHMLYCSPRLELDVLPFLTKEYYSRLIKKPASAGNKTVELSLILRMLGAFVWMDLRSNLCWMIF